MLGSFTLSPVVKADPPIAGLWHEAYTSNVGGPPFETYTQWHSDGLEIETAQLYPRGYVWGLGNTQKAGPSSSSTWDGHPVVFSWSTTERTVRVEGTEYRQRRQK